MGNIRLYGSTSGYTELAPPDVAPDGVLALPSGTGTLATQAYVDTAETDAINTAIAGSGLVHINTTTFSASSAVNINDVFSATYENYLMLIKWTASTIEGLGIRMRVSGADNSASSYVRQRLQAYSTTVGGARGTSTSAVLTNYGTALNSLRADIFNPFASEVTGIIAAAKSSEDTASLNHSVTTHDVASSFTGISLIPGAGTITGTVRIYGYKNS